MARVPLVTRTIQTTTATIMCLDIEKQESVTKDLVLPRVYKDDKAILAAAEKALNSDNVKAVHVLRTEVCETLYGMTEQRFIELADVLPSRKGKANATETN